MAPPLDGFAWDGVVEGILSSPTGEVFVRAWSGVTYRHELGVLSVEPESDARYRVHARGRLLAHQSVSNDDEYLIQLWPSREPIPAEPAWGRLVGNEIVFKMDEF